MLWNRLKVRHNDGEQETPVIFRVDLGIAFKVGAFVEKVSDQRPTILNALKRRVDEQRCHLLLGELLLHQLSKQSPIIHPWKSNLRDAIEVSKGCELYTIHRVFHNYTFAAMPSFIFVTMYKWLKPLIFKTDPERAHYATMGLLRWVCVIPGGAALLRRVFRAPEYPVNVLGMHFPNPVGLAAGFDKDARWLKELDVLGFGFVEIGTLTPVGQGGNPQPRLFRLPADGAVINRMGFNNGGVEDAVNRLKNRPSNLIVGGNIGKNKVTPNELAIQDYLTCMDALHPHVDYFTVNVSSPNTPGLRALQEREPLEALLQAVVQRNREFNPPRPVLLKIAPDMSDGQLDDVVELVQSLGVDGLIATNTTIDRSGLTTDDAAVEAIGAGGLSGVPVRDRSTDVIRYIHKRSNGSFPIIGVGGIDGAESAREKLDAGASLVQVYTGLIYQGPGLVKKIVRGLS